MKSERRFLLQLVALGRVTPAEAERLLVVWSDRRETQWLLAACASAICLSQFHLGRLLPALLKDAHWLHPATSFAARQ
jgi:hypothetical protein